MRAILKKTPPLILQGIYKDIQNGVLPASSTTNTFDDYIKSDYSFPESTSLTAKEQADILQEATLLGCIDTTTQKIQTPRIIQKFLAQEQGFICCYCNQEIPENTDDGSIAMKIEHYKPESLFKGVTIRHAKLCDDTLAFRDDFRIDYNNLLCACKDTKHCDDDGYGKGQWELCAVPNPSAIPARDFYRLTQIYYSNQAYIYSHDAAINTEIGADTDAKDNFLKGKLNLNHPTLARAREGAWNAAFRLIALQHGFAQYPDWRAHLRANRPLANTIIQQYTTQYSQRKPNNKFFEFCEYILFRLKRLV